MSAATQASRSAMKNLGIELGQRIDMVLLLVVVTLLGLGLVMVASASVGVADRLTGNPLHFFTRQLGFAGFGVVIMGCAYRVRVAYWQSLSPVFLLLTIFFLVLVLIPGVGKTVNGSSRWLWMGIFSLQVSELVKLAVILFIASYIDRSSEQIQQSVWGFVKPVLLLIIIGCLLLLEPDFGAVVVIMTITLTMLFLAGTRLSWFILLLALGIVILSLLAYYTPYRMARVTAFLNPWEDPFNTGFQLTQSLIAIGSGGWFGLGLGASVQKLFYLPEAHTDFLFAVLAEELGLLGVVMVLALFFLLVWRCFAIGRDAVLRGRLFAAYFAYGVGIWFGLQAFINIGVNMGTLPTKGLTLPFMSAGGSSMLVTCLAVGMLLRIYRENIGLTVLVGPRDFITVTRL